MAKDSADSQTLDAFPAPASTRRGRKPSGDALSPADRQAAYRLRQRAYIASLELQVQGLEAQILRLQESLRRQGKKPPISSC